MQIEKWFEQGRKRDLPAPLDPPRPSMQIDLGAGKNPVPGAYPIDLERGWNADTDPIPVPLNEQVGAIWMHGFIDYVADPVAVLRQCEHVLMPGGVVNIIVPHAMSELGVSDIHKKTHWTEESFPHLLDNPHYRPEGADIALKLHTQFILGIVWRNLSLFVQLVKT